MSSESIGYQRSENTDVVDVTDCRPVSLSENE